MADLRTKPSTPPARARRLAACDSDGRPRTQGRWPEETRMHKDYKQLYDWFGEDVTMEEMAGSADEELP